jgi:hypothetical protein
MTTNPTPAFGDLTQPPYVPSCVSTGEGVTVQTPAPTPRTGVMAFTALSHNVLDGHNVPIRVVLAEDCERELAAKDAEIENLVWNLAGCDTLAMGYAKPGDFSKELARPALHSVSRLAARAEKAESDLAAANAECNRLITERDRAEADLQYTKAALAAAVEDKARLRASAARLAVERDRLAAEIQELIEANRGLCKDNSTLALQVGSLHGTLADVKSALRRVSDIKWGHDGDCGASNIADQALARIAATRNQP